ncbi:hypothetical protein AAG594_10930 [Citromicrobium bathyomarinum]
MSALITAIIAWMVYDYGKKRDRTAIVHEMWRQQQDWNLTSAGSPAHARAVELMVYGGEPKDENERLALNAALFFFINRINHIYDAYCNGILSKRDFEQEARATAPLLVGNKALLYSLLDNRGYDSDFANALKTIVEPIEVTGDVNVFAKKGRPLAAPS